MVALALALEEVEGLLLLFLQAGRASKAAAVNRDRVRTNVDLDLIVFGFKSFVFIEKKRLNPDNSIRRLSLNNPILSCRGSHNYALLFDHYIMFSGRLGAVRPGGGLRGRV